MSLFQWQKCIRYLALIKDRVVGHMAVIPQQFKMGAEEITLAWGSTLVLDMNDFAVKTFAGVALLDICFDNPSYIYAGVGIVPEIESSYIRKGYTICRRAVKMYARFFRPVKALKYYIKPAFFDFPMRAVNWLRPVPQAVGRAGNIKCRDFDAAWDSRWLKMLSDRYELFGIRTAAFLNYKISQPAKKYFSIIHGGDNGPDGYIVFRQARHYTRDLNIIRICDIVGTDRARLALIAEAISFAQEAGLDGIVAVGSIRDAEFYRAAGMWLTRDFPVGLRPDLASKIHLTFFDSDLDNLW
jgi:hypothetical protein